MGCIELYGDTWTLRFGSGGLRKHSPKMENQKQKYMYNDMQTLNCVQVLNGDYVRWKPDQLRTFWS